MKNIITFQKARYELAKKYPYLATILFNLNFCQHDQMPVKFSISDSWTIYINSEEWNKDQALIVLYLACSSILRKHKERMGIKNPTAWDKACFIVSGMGVRYDLGLNTLTYQDTNFYKTYKYEENIYAHLNSENCSVSLGGITGNKQKWESNGSSSQEVVQKALVELTLHKAISEGYGSLALYAKESKTKSRPWEQLLYYSLLRKLSWFKGQIDYSLSVPRQKYGIIYPTLKDKDIKVTIIVDTSGSISSSQLNKCVNHIKDILKALSFRTVKLICWDEDLKSEQDINELNEIRTTGGGGTNMIKAIQYAVNQNPDIIIVLTDGLCPWQEFQVKPKIILVIHENGLKPKLNSVEII